MIDQHYIARYRHFHRFKIEFNKIIVIFLVKRFNPSSWERKTKKRSNLTMKTNDAAHLAFRLAGNDSLWEINLSEFISSRHERHRLFQLFSPVISLARNRDLHSSHPIFRKALIEKICKIRVSRQDKFETRLYCYSASNLSIRKSVTAIHSIASHCSVDVALFNVPRRSIHHIHDVRT